jgi:hypothetical protein
MEIPRCIVIEYIADMRTPYPIEVHDGGGTGEHVQLRNEHEIVNTNPQIDPVAISINQVLRY